MADMKLWALAYAKLSWPVFRITGYKTPLKGSHGHLDATTDPATIEAWWTEKPNSNLALACGDVVVIDADGPAAIERLRRIMGEGGAPRTAVAQTARGLHFYYRAPANVHVRTRNEPREKSGDDGIDIKAHGGWVVLPPSISAKSRFQYRWISPLPIAELPEWLLGALMPEHKTSARSDFKLGPRPQYLNTNQPDISASLEQSLKTIWDPSEQARIESALSAIPVTCGYDAFLRIGMALKTLDWERSDGSSTGFEIWDRWCAQAEQHNTAGLEAKWNSFKRDGTTVATIYHLARQHGWTGGAPAPLGADAVGAAPVGLNGHVNGHTALPTAFLTTSQAIFFPDRTDEGKLRATMTNAKVAIGALGVDCRYDLFHNRMLVAGELISRWNSSELSDHVTSMLRDHIRYKFGFDPGKQSTQDAAEILCLNRRFDPVVDYLDELQWDGQSRLDNWLSTYMGAAATELNRAISRLSLIAAVRRVRQPGTKFDQVIVLEGRQGQGKSEAIRILAGAENFSDHKILGVDDRKQQELTEGVWLYEIAELTGLRKAEIEHVKAFVSRTVDRARPAYGRYTINQPRRTIFFGSTNQDVYLQDDTGNRRFWPVAIDRIDLVGLRRDRDQLWAEASAREARAESHFLPESLWGAAAEEQENRSASDEWAPLINDYIALKGVNEVSIMQVLTDNQFLQLRPSDVGQKEQSRAASVLRSLDFVRCQKRVPGGKRVWVYRRA